MSRRYENKIALVTGGTTGIGLATAERLAAEGATVVVTGRNPDTLQKAKEKLAGRAEVVASDAADPAAIEALIAKIEADHGRIDLLFLNAGIAHFAPLSDAPLEDFDRMFAINVRGPWLTLKAASRILAEGASVVFNTSVVNVKGLAGATAYGATKAALRSIVRSAAVELAERNIRVNAVSPGPIETPIYGKMGMPEEALNGFAQGIAAQVPLQRFGQADDIAAAVAFLGSAEAAYINAAELPVDGGFGSV